MSRIKFILTAALLAALWSGCSEESNGTGSNGGPDSIPPPPKFEAKAPDFNADSAYAYVEKQLEFGPRVPNTEAHAQAAEWMVSKLKSFGAKVQVQEADLKTHDGQIFHAKNIIASFRPEVGNRLMVSAHWDSRPMADKDPAKPTEAVPGANDGASGVAVIMEIARQIGQTPPAVGVDLILFDAEDNGAYDVSHSFCLGSQHWAKNPHKPNYMPLFGINLDMVGAKNARFYREGFSMQYGQAHVDHVWDIASKIGYGGYFQKQIDRDGVIDDHYYVITGANIPMVEIIDRDLSTGDFFPHWHKTTDDLSQISKETLKATGQTVLETIFQEN